MKKELLIFVLILLLSLNASANWVPFANGGFEDGNLGSGSAGNWTASQPTKLITSTENSYEGSKNAHTIDATNDSGNLNWTQSMPTNSISNTNHWHLKWHIATDGASQYSIFKTGSVDCFIYESGATNESLNSGGLYVERTGFCTKTDATTTWFFQPKSGGATANIRLDDIQYWQFEDINIQNNSPSNATKDENFTISIQVFGKDTHTFGESPDTNAYINFNNEGVQQMDFVPASKTYQKTFVKSTSGTYFYDINAIQSTFNSTSASITNQQIDIFTNPAEFLTFTPVENIASYFFSSVDITPSNESNQLIWRIDSNSGSVETILYKIFNSLNDGKQYTIYTADLNNFLIENWSFNDTLTFGSTSSNPIQKIWDGNNQRYTYSFSDSINPTETKYYRLTYENPYKSYNSISGSSDWVNGLSPQQIDGNGIPTDSFQTSSFSNIRSFYNEAIPQISGGTGQSFEFQFTAFADSPSSVSVATSINELDTLVETIPITTTPHTYSVGIDSSDFEDLLLFKTNNTSPINVFIYNYTIVPRKYFTKRLNLLKSNGDDLDNILISNVSNPYLQEGIPFKITSQAYDKIGSLRRLDLVGYLDTNADVNKVSRQISVLTSIPQTIINFNETFNGIIDLSGNGNSSIKTLFVKAFLYDDQNLIVAEQSKAIKFIQFPYFGNDLKINFLPTEKRVGKNPSGVLEFNIKDSGILNGFDIRIFNAGSSINSPEYSKRLYKNKDFNCTSATDCSLNLKITDWIYEDTNFVHVAITSMLNTETFSLTNSLTQSLRIFNLATTNFETETIYQVNERSDFTYRPDEEIPLVLILRDSEAGNIKDKYNVSMVVRVCDSSGNNCTDEATKFSPTGFLFDASNNFNLFFFRHFWSMSNGNSLPDGNKIEFHSVITDNTGVVQPSVAVLTSKCFDQNYDFFGNQFFASQILAGLSHFLGFSDPAFASLGCLQAQYSITTTTTNTGQEKQITINSGRTTTAPNQTLFACLSPDNNNVLGKPLEQNLYCFSWYKVAEQPIDDFRLRIGNKFSDYSALSTSKTKQYVEFNIPYELISYNDISLARKELEVNQNTTITSIGDFFFAGLNAITNSQLSFWGINDKANFLTKNGLITNIGADVNFGDLFNPTNISGASFYVIKALPIINSVDYKTNSIVSPVYDSLDRKHFLDYLATNNITIPKSNANLEVQINDFSIPVKLTDNGHILIDEVAFTTQVKNENLDVNQQQKFNIPPNQLILLLSHTMFYDSFNGNNTLSTTIRILFNVQTSFFVALDQLLTDPAGATGGFIFDNIIFIAIGMGLLLVFSVIISRLRSGGNNGGNSFA